MLKINTRIVLINEKITFLTLPEDHFFEAWTKSDNIINITPLSGKIEI